MILGDRDLRYYIERGLIRVEPFDPSIVRENGLDLRLGGQVARLKRTDRPFDPRSPPEDLGEYYEVEEGESFVIGPRERVLLTTLEYIRLPADVMAFVNLRSSFARLGIYCPPTIVDAGFEGTLTVELVGGEFPVVLHAGDRFLHLVFAKLTSPVERPYRGAYLGQRGVTLPRFGRGSL